MARDNINYSHGDNGIEPSSALDFQQNQRPDAQKFDWFWSTVINRINGINSEFNRLDSNDDGKVDAADQADNADTLDGQNYSDIQNWVNNNADVPNADYADNAGDAETLGGKSRTYFTTLAEKSYINGYQSNTLSDIDVGIDGGTLANCWETIEVNSGEFTIVDNNTIEVNEAGVYSVDYTCGIHQTSGDSRAITQAKVLINGNGNFAHTGSFCYIRNNNVGDRNSVSNHSMHSLNAGDTIEVRVSHFSGASGHDLTEASCVVQKIA